MAKLGLGGVVGQEHGEMGLILPAKLEGDMSDGDTVAPLPPPALATPSPNWALQAPNATPSMVPPFCP